MILSLPERYVLLELIPKEGSYTTLKILRKLRESLSFSEEEVKKFKLKEEFTSDGKMLVTWDMNLATNTEIPLGEVASSIIVDALKALDAKGKLTEREMSVFEKFVIA